jgi:hypothetical protein
VDVVNFFVAMDHEGASIVLHVAEGGEDHNAFLFALPHEHRDFVSGGAVLFSAEDEARVIC